MTETKREAKLVQYLSEAYGKEKELETALEAHIGMTTRKPYKKRLQDHLKETKSHAVAGEPDQADRRRRPAADRQGRRAGERKAKASPRGRCTWSAV